MVRHLNNLAKGEFQEWRSKNIVRDAQLITITPTCLISNDFANPANKPYIALQIKTPGDDVYLLYIAAAPDASHWYRIAKLSPTQLRVMGGRYRKRDQVVDLIDKKSVEEAIKTLMEQINGHING